MGLSRARAQGRCPPPVPARAAARGGGRGAAALGPCPARAHVRYMCFVCIYVYIHVCICVYTWYLVPRTRYQGMRPEVKNPSKIPTEHGTVCYSCFFSESPEATALHRCEQCPRRSAAPQILMQVGPCSSNCCHKGPQGATPRTRPPAPPPLGRRPQAAWTVHCTPRRPRTLVPAPSIKRTSSSNPEGPLRSDAAGKHHPALWVFLYPDTGHSRLPATGHLPVVSLESPAPAPCHCHGFPQQVVPRVAQSILGPARRAGGEKLSTCVDRVAAQ